MTYDEKSCGLVLFRQKDGDEPLFLLLHYPNGHWDLVKGHVEKGETELETAKRELTEETGIKDCEIISGYREQISYQYVTHHGEPSHKEVIFFLAKTSEDAVETSHEHQDFIWLSYEKAVEKLTFDNAKQLLIKAKEFLED